MADRNVIFQTTALVSSIFPLLAFFGIFIIPESPAWLIRQKQDFNGAKKSLSRLHRSPLQFAEEVRSFSTKAINTANMDHFRVHNQLLLFQFDNPLKERILASMDSIAIPSKEISRLGNYYTNPGNKNMLQSGSAILESMKYQSISKQGQDLMSSIFSRETMVPLFVLSMLFFIQSWSGAIVVFFFGVSIFQVTKFHIFLKLLVIIY